MTSEIERLKRVEEFVECTGRARAVLDRAKEAEAQLQAAKAELVRAQQAFTDLREADRETIVEALAGALEANQRAEAAEAKLTGVERERDELTEACTLANGELGKIIAAQCQALHWEERAKEAEADLVRAIDLVRYCRVELHSEELITDEEYAALVEDSEAGKRVARLEGYDAMRKCAEAAEAKLAAVLNPPEGVRDEDTNHSGCARSHPPRIAPSRGR